MCEGELVSDEPDPRFLGGEDAVLTDVSKMRWAVAVGWDGAADIHANVDKTMMVAEMRYIADHLEGQERT